MDRLTPNISSERVFLNKLRPVLDRASSVWIASSYVIPPGLQTYDYAASIRRSSNSNRRYAEELAAYRIEYESETRSRIPTQYLIGAAALQHTYYADRQTMLEQISHIEQTILDTTILDTANRTTVGIVPNTIIKPLSAGLPPKINPLIAERDVQVIRSNAECHIIWDETREVCNSPAMSGEFGVEAKMRLDGVESFWLQHAKFGNEALEQLDLSRAVLRSQI